MIFNSNVLIFLRLCYVCCCLIRADDLVVLLEVSTAIRIMTAVDLQCSVSDTAAPDSEKLAF